MQKQTRLNLLLLSAALLVGILVYTAIYQLDNKYTAALPGGSGVNVLAGDPEQVAFLVDGWAYYPGQLLEPEDFSEGVSPEEYIYIGQYSNFSSHLDSPYGVATYRLTLEYSGQAAQLSLYLPELLCAGRVYINGNLAGEHGSLSPYAPQVIDRVYTFAATPQIEIVIQCANYTHYSSGLYYPPAVGTPNSISLMLVARMVIYGLLCFCALGIAICNLALWLPGRDRLARWLGLLCLSFALWVSYPFLRAAGVTLVRPLYALEDFCANFVLLCAVQLAGEISGWMTHRLHRCFALPAAASLCAVPVIFPLIILPYVPAFINVYGIILFLWKLLAGLYLLFLALQSLRTQTVLGRYLLCASGLYGLSIAISILTANRFEPIRGAWPAEYGGLALVIGFTALMVHRGTLLTRENRRLTLHLQKEVDRKTMALEQLLTERRELLANLIHDVKNPLSALRSYAELVQSDGVALDEQTAACLEALNDRVCALSQRFNQLQDFSRAERGQVPMEPICLNEFLQEFFRCNRPDMELSGQAFRLRLPSQKLFVLAERERLWIALENLCYNALSFTPPDGSIALTLTQREQTAVITVRDTGCGIAPEDLPHVFDRGFTSRDSGDGDGLGLWIVRTIALEHSGWVQASSQPGKGSVFTLALPICASTSDHNRSDAG